MKATPTPKFTPESFTKVEFEMNAFSREVALIWARANAESWSSVSGSASGFGAAVVRVAKEAQASMDAADAADAAVSAAAVIPGSPTIPR